jgi:hypothetical protein
VGAAVTLAAGAPGERDPHAVAGVAAAAALSAPALLGSCCWPLLLAGLAGGAATAAARTAAHTASFGLSLAILTNLVQLTAHKCRASGRYGPAWAAAAATALLMADPTRHVLQDAGVWSGPGSNMYAEGCTDASGLRGLSCLTPLGWLSSVLATGAGFALLCWSTLRATSDARCRAAWRAR